MREENKEIKGINERFTVELEGLTKQCPTFDANGRPTNDVARAIQNLRRKKTRDVKAIKDKLSLSDKTSQVAKNINAALVYEEKDLAAFDPVEQAILRVYFTDLTRPYGEIAKYLAAEGVTQQLVTALIERPEVGDLVFNLMKSDIKRVCGLAILKGCRSNDPKMIELAAKYNLFTIDGASGGACKESHATPIEDPEAEKALKAIGDTLAIRGIGDIMAKVEQWATKRDYDLVFPAEKLQ